MKLIPMILSRNLVSPFKTMMVDLDNLPGDYLMYPFMAAIAAGN